MTFNEWWKSIDKDFSKDAIPEEIEWFAEKSWNAAVQEIREQERTSKVDKKR